ncbi:lantibiotic dehydratase [Actinomyces howellii]|nr:lantibiotic dehydratase [Actinomyces howellii]
MEKLALLPPLINALEWSAPSLAQALRRTSNGEKMDPLRNGVRHDRLARFIYRALTKTSPYSTFTLSAPVSNDGVPLSSVQDRDIFLVRQIDGRILAAVISEVMASTGENSKSYVRVNPSLTSRKSKDSGYIVIGPLPKEQVRLLKSSPVLDVLHETMSAEPILRSDLIPHVAQGLGVGRNEADRVITAALTAGVLQVDPPITENTIAPVETLRDWVVGLVDDNQAVPYLRELNALTQFLAKPEKITDAHLPKRNDGRTAAIRSTDRIIESLGINEIEQSLHESSQVSLAVRCRTPNMAVAKNIAATYAWLSLGDPGLPGRLALGQYANERIPGEAVSLVEFYFDYQTYLRKADKNDISSYAFWFAPSMPQPENLALSKSVPTVLHELAKFRQHQKMIVEHASDEDNILRISEATVEKELSSIPRHMICTQGCTAYIQDVGDDVVDKWVINVLHGGNGRGHARYDYLRTQVPTTDQQLYHYQEYRNGNEVTRPKRMHTSVSDPNAAYAEYSGLHGSSLNFRAPVLDAVIDYPYTALDARDRSIIPISSIDVCLDRRDTTVYLSDRRTGRKVIPAHLGMAADYQLSPFARFIERFFGETFLMHPSNPPFASSFELSSLGEITEVPRVEVGSLIVRRKRWILRAGIVREDTQCTSEVERWQHVRRFFWEHDLPQRGYMRVWPSYRENVAKSDKSRKPMYYDLDSWWTVCRVPRWLETDGFLVIDEAVPDVYTTASQDRCTELVAEYSSYFDDDSREDA